MNLEKKKELCDWIIEDFCFQQIINKNSLTRIDMYSQTNLGIAMQYLGLTADWTESDFDYINSRDGTIKHYIKSPDKIFTLSLRDILNYYPRRGD